MKIFFRKSFAVVAAWSAGRRRLILSMPAVCLAAGCGLIEIERSIFPAHAIGIDGELLFVEDLLDVTGDTDATASEMEESLRDLGIESDELIDAVISDGLDGTSSSVVLTP